MYQRPDVQARHEHAADAIAALVATRRVLAGVGFTYRAMDPTPGCVEGRSIGREARTE